MNGSSSSRTKNNEVSKISRGQADDFSSLPADVLAYISSFLTSKEALNVCFSCKKLKPFTTSIPNIEITEAENGCPAKKEEFIISISRFLAKHNSVVRKFQLSFFPEKKYQRLVLHWLSSVVKNGIEELDLMLYDSEYMEIPVSQLTIGNLKVLRLRYCKVDLPSLAGLKFLKTLLLGAMPITDYEMGLFFSHCESLQHLTLEKCFAFEEIKIVDPRCKLETLVLDGHCLNLSRLNILRLKTLVVRRRSMNFSIINCPNIDEVVLSRVGAGGITEQEYENMKANIINKLGKVRSLQLAGWAFQIVEDLYAGDYAIVTDPPFKEMSIYFLLTKNKGYPRVGFGNEALHDVEIKNFRGSMDELKLIYSVLEHVPHLRVLKVTPMMEIDEDLLSDFAKLFSRFPRGSTNVCMLLGSQEVLNES
ncbi:F-box/LRR-repeat protein At1g52650-like [Apium graveolens]|uniref:F-box/LRR-repeat protein At1g52650-like n=1 Tax=Apium graveolens TaxID=4045 RepID=UPI003D78B531